SLYMIKGVDVKNIKGIKELTKLCQNHEITTELVELDNGDLYGILKGSRKIMSNTKKPTINDLVELMNKGFGDMRIDMDKKFKAIDMRFEAIDKRFEALEEKIDKRFDIIEKKIDLMLATPTMQKEIDHEALSKLI
ncbi:MAG: hypothetical protein ACRCXE_02445, partial [Metamycoplasmataceae bacterium]